MTKYSNLIKNSAKIDTVLFTLLALPYISAYALSLLFELAATLGDQRPIPNLSDPFLQLAICLIGVFGLFTVWARLKIGTLQVGKAVGTVKIGAALLFGLSVLAGAPFILLLFMAIDLITGLQLFSIKETKA